MAQKTSIIFLISVILTVEKLSASVYNDMRASRPGAALCQRGGLRHAIGFDKEGNVIGGLVINSKINYNLPSTVTDYQLPITVKQCPFLQHNSFVNCSKIIVAKRTKFSKDTYRGEISDTEVMRLIIDTVKESPTINRKQLKDFGII